MSSGLNFLIPHACQHAAQAGLVGGDVEGG